MFVQARRVINPNERVPPDEPAYVFTQVRGRCILGRSIYFSGRTKYYGMGGLGC
jgi:hypothetical protein